MKLSTIKNVKGKGIAMKTWPLATFIERIKVDANHFLLSEFRLELHPEQPERFRRYEEIPQVTAAVELCKQANGALGMKAYNGLVVLEVRGLMNPNRCEEVKQSAMAMSSTLAAFTGATGQEVIILVKVVRADGTLPTTEVEADTFYATAYKRMATIYDAALSEKVTRMEPFLRHSFLFPLDPHPMLNLDAQPYPIQPTTRSADADTPDDHLLALPEQRQAEEVDMTAYMNYERAYESIADEVVKKLDGLQKQSNEYYQSYVTGMATALCKQGWPLEESVCHLWRHLVFKDWPGLTEDFVRTLVEAAYAEGADRRGKERQQNIPHEPLMQELIRRMESRYAFRYNTIMGYAEYRPNHTWITPWKPVTEKAINTFTTDLQLAGMTVWDRDVKRYVHSTRVHDFNPIEDYLYRLAKHWDGRDHIRALAATVPTPYPEQWAEWFHTWFLAMIAQWQGRDARYGNSLVPLLVSSQGMHKSAFCRHLLPLELRRWGYTDNLSLGEERPVHLAMSQMLLINLDEFNRISPQKQQGFLKNIVQLPSVKVKRPYASHTEDVPRLASFIATTNIADVLADPSGSRRFIGVEVLQDIDMSQTPNYEQLYAQALTELDGGARYWLDDKETAAVMEHNRKFQQLPPSAQFFLDYFEACNPADRDALWMTTTELIRAIKKQAKSAFTTPSTIQFGRTIREIPGMVHRRSKYGEQYCVRPR